jgi:CBS domain containing-hemolysin-like protein
MEIAILTIILLGLTFLSAYFSSSEAALFSLSTPKIRAYQGDKDPVKQLIASLILRPRDLLVTIFLLNTLVNILLQNTASHMFGSEASWLFSIGIPFVLTLFLGEMVPKYFGLKNSISLSHIVAPQLVYVHNFLQPIRRIIIAITLPISRLLFFFLKEEPQISKEELKHVLKSSEAHGVLSKEEAALVWGYLDFIDSQVIELMRRREEITFYLLQEPLDKLIQMLCDKKFSRIPVCDKSLDNVIGIIQAETYFLKKEFIRSPEDLRKYLAKPLYVPETTSALWLLRRFAREQEQFALVLDEYSSVVGVISKEDLLDVVINPVEERESLQLFTRTGDNQLIASGTLELEELNEILSIHLVSKYNMLTIGGWLTEQVGDIPKVGAIYHFDGLRLQVLSASPSRVQRLYIRKEGTP